MKCEAEQVLDLLVRAVGPTMEVRRVGEAEFALAIAGGSPVRFQMIGENGEGGEEGEAAPVRLRILRRPTAAELERLREAGESFVALNGAVRIQGPGILIDRANLGPVPSLRPGSARSAFSDRASLVPRALFSAAPDEEWTLSGLVDATGLSPSSTSYALRDLEERGVLEMRKVGREKKVRLPSRTALIEEWSREYHWRDNAGLRVMAPVGAPQKFLNRMGAALGNHRWAATLQAGASLLVRHALVDQVHVYVDVSTGADLLSVARKAGWGPGEEGALFLLSPRYPRSLWQGLVVVDEVPLVSPLQLILDLWNHPLRGREQAETILGALESGETPW